MKTRVIARYLSKEGYNEIGDREVDLDQYEEIEVETVDAGVTLIAEKELNGVGQVFEQVQREEYGLWDDIREHWVDGGIVFNTEVT